MDLQNLLKQYLTENRLMQLATVSASGQPWLCNVYFVADEHNNLYWTSARKRQHSQEILGNPASAVTIVHDPDRKQALQLTGQSFEVQPNDVERIHNLYGDKFGQKDSRLDEVRANFPDGEGRAYWVFKPTTIAFWDEVNFPDTPKQELSL